MIISPNTRIIQYSETNNNLSNKLSTKVLSLGPSDYCPVLIAKKRNSSSVSKKFHHSISYRSFENLNESEFIEDLFSTPWPSLVTQM